MVKNDRNISLRSCRTQSSKTQNTHKTPSPNPSTIPHPHRSRRQREPRPRYLHCASSPRRNKERGRRGPGFHTFHKSIKKRDKIKKQTGERPPPILLPPPPGPSPPRWPPPPSRPSRRRRPPRRRAWPRATPSPPQPPRAAPPSRSATPRVGPPSSRSAPPPPPRLPPSAACTAAPSRPGGFLPDRASSRLLLGPSVLFGGFPPRSPSADSRSVCRVVPCRSRRRAQGFGAASASASDLAASTWGAAAGRDGCLSCFPKSRRGRSGLARFAPCALPHASGLSFRSRLSGAKVCTQSHPLLRLECNHDAALAAFGLRECREKFQHHTSLGSFC